MKASTKTLCSITQAFFMGYDGTLVCGTCVLEVAFPVFCPAVIDLTRQATLAFAFNLTNTKAAESLL